MKLPDYSKHDDLSRLHEEMEISDECRKLENEIMNIAIELALKRRFPTTKALSPGHCVSGEKN